MLEKQINPTIFMIRPISLLVIELDLLASTAFDTAKRALVVAESSARSTASSTATTETTSTAASST
jgi:hypothetical protein